MNRYEIEESKPAMIYWTHVVYANSEEEAIQKCMDGESEVVNTDMEEAHSADSEYWVSNLETPSDSSNALKHI